MASLFKENVPAANSALKSEDVRDNFAALYEKVKPLEVRAETPISTSVLVSGGPVYFRSKDSSQLRLINFNTTVFDFTSIVGYKTIRNLNGTISRELQSTSGPSDFESQGLILEVLISLTSDNQLVFTESVSAQNNELSSPFNIFFADGEIPIALILLRKSNEGVLQPINQTDIKDIRPVITTAFENLDQAAVLQANVSDLTSRVDLIEPTLYLSNNLLTRFIPTAKLKADNKETSNTRVEVLSGTAQDGYGNFLEFGGGYVDLAVGAVTSGRTYSAGTTAGTAGYWNKVIISLSYINATENCQLNFIFGTQSTSPDSIILPSLPSDHIPLSIVLYKMNSSGTNIEPIISQVNIGSGEQLVREFTIISLEDVPLAPDEAFIGFEIDYSGTNLNQSNITSDFGSGKVIDISDDNTRPVRRITDGDPTFPESGKARITVTDSFIDISLLRNPKVRSVAAHTNIITDLRPFIGIS